MSTDYRMIVQPPDLNIKLYPHQLANIYDMEKLESEKYIELNNNENIFTDIGINGNISGCGKTLSMVGLILRNKMEWDLDINYLKEINTIYCSNHIKKVSRLYYQKIDCTLILASNSIIHQWEKELSYTNLKFCKITNPKSLESLNINNFNVIIVSPLFFNVLMLKYQRVAWKRFIYDEPENSRVILMKNINFGFMWIITTEPYFLSNKYKLYKKNFMNTLFKDIYFCTIIKHILIKQDIEFINKSFLKNDIEHKYYICHSPVYSVIKDMVDSTISQMLEANNIEGIINSLGGEKTSNIIELVKNKKNEELLEIKNKLLFLENDEKLLEIKNKIEGDIQKIDDRFKNIFNENCSICYDKKVKPILEPNCQNTFCGKCLFVWMKEKGTCPLCRKLIESKNLIFIETKHENTLLSTKEKTIIEIINTDKNRKYIIFSDWDESFNKIRTLLKDNLIEFIEIRGSANIRASKIEKFKNGNINILFLNSNTDSSGLNLQETTDIILYHTMNESIKMQIINKVNRIGRTKILNVHHLIFE